MDEAGERRLDPVIERVTGRDAGSILVVRQRCEERVTEVTGARVEVRAFEIPGTSEVNVEAPLGGSARNVVGDVLGDLRQPVVDVSDHERGCRSQPCEDIEETGRIRAPRYRDDDPVAFLQHLVAVDRPGDPLGE